LSKRTGTGDGYALWVEDEDVLRFYATPVGSAIDLQAGSITDSNWHYAVVTLDRDGNAVLYLDGSPAMTIDISSSAGSIDSTQLFAFGAQYTTGVLQTMNGSLDEVRLSDVARSSEWIGTCYNNQIDPDTFINSIGNQEILSEEPLILYPNPNQGDVFVPISLSKLNFTLLDYQNDSMNYTVETSPDIGSGNATAVNNGIQHIIITNLGYNVTYTWFVNVTDGTHWTNQTYHFTVEPNPGTWWNHHWSYRKPIIIPHQNIDENLTSFPVCINIIDLNLSMHAQSDGDDIVFTSYSGTPLHHQIEYYDNETGMLLCWVNVPHLSSTVDTILYLYYGNPTCENQENVIETWNNGYEAVWHFNETTGSTLFDATINSNDGILKGNITTDIDGLFGPSYYIDGFTGNYIDSIRPITDLVPWTIECWFKHGDNADDEKWGNSWSCEAGSHKFPTQFEKQNDQWKWGVYANALDDDCYINIAEDNTTWYYGVTCGNASNAQVLKDGVLQDTKTVTSGAGNIGGGNWTIASRYMEDDEWTNITIDEMRISSVKRSNAWLNACYHSIYNSDTFLNMGTEETQPLVGWQITLDLFGPDGVNDTVVFGEKTNASDEEDSYDIPKPGTPPSPYVYAYFDTDLSIPYDRLWHDIRSYPDTYKVWNLSVKWTDSGDENITISWNSTLINTTEYEYVMLKDMNTGHLTDMQMVSSYTYFASDGVDYDFQIICSMLPLTVDYHKALNPYWNLVSLPVNDTVSTDDIMVEYLGVNYTWQQAVDNGTVLGFVYGWNNGSQSYVVVDSFESGQGYWLYAFVDCTLWITGDDNDDEFISDLGVQWNIAGLPFEDDVAVADLIVSYNGTVYPWFNATSSNNDLGMPILLGFVYGWNSSSQSYVTIDTLNPGQGYWLYTYYECILKREVI